MWFVATSLTAVGRYLVYKAFNRNPPPEEAHVGRPLHRRHDPRGRVWP
jgi:hypothetical protein